GGQAGADQVTFGPLHGREAAGRAAVEEDEQFGGGSGVGQVVGGAGGQRPGPPQVLVADATAPAAGARADTDDAGVTSTRAAPRAGQNRFPGANSWPHDGQPPTGAPQSPQNRSPSSRVAPHRPYPTPRPPSSAR